MNLLVGLLTFVGLGSRDWAWNTKVCPVAEGILGFTIERILHRPG
jgi:hypothetical protein